ncbi:MAG TPA: hypothetical protein VFC90_03515 [Planctomycetota bacterium]|nr:hypothetical protein [Planctomycetota bacterium]
MRNPTTAPRMLPTRSTVAYHHDRFGRSSDSATCRNSGGTGKTDESTNAKNASAHVPSG